MDKRVFKIDGMMCNHCRANVEKALQSLQGVDNVAVDLAAGTATVTGAATDDAIVSAITAIGYGAEKA